MQRCSSVPPSADLQKYIESALGIFFSHAQYCFKTDLSGFFFFFFLARAGTSATSTAASSRGFRPSSPSSSSRTTTGSASSPSARPTWGRPSGRISELQQDSDEGKAVVYLSVFANQGQRAHQAPQAGRGRPGAAPEGGGQLPASGELDMGVGPAPRSEQVI